MGHPSFYRQFPGDAVVLLRARARHQWPAHRVPQGGEGGYGEIHSKTATVTFTPRLKQLSRRLGHDIGITVSPKAGRADMAKACRKRHPEPDSDVQRDRNRVIGTTVSPKAGEGAPVCTTPCPEHPGGTAFRGPGPCHGGKRGATTVQDKACSPVLLVIVPTRGNPGGIL